MEGKDAEPDAEVSSLWREYEFRRVFGGTHDEFLDQPSEVIDWLLRINTVVREIEHG